MRVTCIMPTADRRAHVGGAIAAFRRQTYADRELLILDDGTDPVADLVPDDPRVRYWRGETRRVIGAARNWLCERAAGDVIVHWDDDDWHGPERVAAQVAALVAARADIAGLATVPFLRGDGAAAWDYVWEAPRPWVYGASFVYGRDFWARHRFPDIHIGEDNAFVLGNPGRVLAMADADVVFRVHDGNSATKNTGGRHWRARDPAPLLARVKASGAW